jgi:hypothetical protein
MYIVSILLCEPFTPQQRASKERVFDIEVNGESWQQQLSIEKQYGVQTAVILDKMIEVKSGESINIQFKSIKGLTILNGVSIRRML